VRITAALFPGSERPSSTILSPSIRVETTFWRRANRCGRRSSEMFTLMPIAGAGIVCNISKFIQQLIDDSSILRLRPWRYRCPGGRQRRQRGVGGVKLLRERTAGECNSGQKKEEKYDEKYSRSLPNHGKEGQSQSLRLLCHQPFRRLQLHFHSPHAPAHGKNINAHTIRHHDRVNKFSERHSSRQPRCPANDSTSSPRGTEVRDLHVRELVSQASLLQ